MHSAWRATPWNACEFGDVNIGGVAPFWGLGVSGTWAFRGLGTKRRVVGCGSAARKFYALVIQDNCCSGGWYWWVPASLRLVEVRGTQAPCARGPLPAAHCKVRFDAIGGIPSGTTQPSSPPVARGWVAAETWRVARLGTSRPPTRCRPAAAGIRQGCSASSPVPGW